MRRLCADLVLLSLLPLAALAGPQVECASGSGCRSDRGDESVALQVAHVRARDLSLLGANASQLPLFPFDFDIDSREMAACVKNGFDCLSICYLVFTMCEGIFDVGENVCAMSKDILDNGFKLAITGAIAVLLPGVGWDLPIAAVLGKLVTDYLIPTMGKAIDLTCSTATSFSEDLADGTSLVKQCMAAVKSFSGGLEGMSDRLGTSLGGLLLGDVQQCCNSETRRRRRAGYCGGSERRRRGWSGGDVGGEDVDLSVTIESASNLPDEDSIPGSGVSDPYCIVAVKGKEGNEEVRTETLTDESNPEWNHEGLLEDWDVGENLVISCWDEDYGVGGDDSLGEAVLESSQFYPGGFSGEVPISSGGWFSLAQANQSESQGGIVQRRKPAAKVAIRPAGAQTCAKSKEKSFHASLNRRGLPQLKTGMDCSSSRNKGCYACGLWWQRGCWNRRKGVQECSKQNVCATQELTMPCSGAVAGMEAVSWKNASKLDYLWQVAADRMKDADKDSDYVLLINPMEKKSQAGAFLRTQWHMHIHNKFVGKACYKRNSDRKHDCKDRNAANTSQDNVNAVKKALKKRCKVADWDKIARTISVGNGKCSQAWAKPLKNLTSVFSSMWEGPNAPVKSRDSTLRYFGISIWSVKCPSKPNEPSKTKKIALVTVDCSLEEALFKGSTTITLS